MKRELKWNFLLGCALVAFADSAPVTIAAQTKKKAATARSAAKTKEPAKRNIGKADKPVVTTGMFKPLTNTDRITVILPRRPATRASLPAMTSRRTVFTQRTVRASPKTVNSVTETNFGRTAIIVNSSRSWWGYGGPPSTSYFDARHGWITVVNYGWGDVMYTYGYQVVNYWNGRDYDWVSYRGVPGVAYPVIFR